MGLSSTIIEHIFEYYGYDVETHCIEPELEDNASVKKRTRKHKRSKKVTINSDNEEEDNDDFELMLENENNSYLDDDEREGANKKR